MFGHDLCLLVSDDIQIPVVVARLINEIENKGKWKHLIVLALLYSCYYVIQCLFVYSLPYT